VVFGENPYAEFQGDLKVLTLPGTEGGGISDVLFRKRDGAVNYDFTGKLSFSWPRDATGTPLNVSKEPYDPLFPLGYGLTYAAPAEVAALPEDPGIPAELMSTGSFFDKGMPVQPWSLRVSNGSDTTRITTVPVETVGGRVKVTAVDDTVQEGARRFVFDGSGGAAVQVTSEGTVDLSREANGDVMLLVRLRRDSEAPKDVKLGMGCGAGCGGSLPFAETLASLPKGKWQTVGVPLKCFAKAGVDVSKVNQALSIESEGKLDMAISQAKLGTVADKTYACN
jgi:beta-glucosidase